MYRMQKVGGYAALIEAATFIVGFALFLTMLAPMTGGSLNQVETVAFITDHAAILYIWNLIIYVLFGVFLVVLALALHERLRDGAPALMQVATVFGLIWAGLVIAAGMVANIGAAAVIEQFATDPDQAATLWLAVSTVQNGIGGGNEIVGGLWVVLVSWAALQGRTLIRFLNYFGLVIGAAGIVTLVPALTDVGALFGLGTIVWFLWVGVVMLRTPDSPVAATEASKE